MRQWLYANKTLIPRILLDSYFYLIRMLSIINRAHPWALLVGYILVPTNKDQDMHTLLPLFSNNINTSYARETPKSSKIHHWITHMLIWRPPGFITTTQAWRWHKGYPSDTNSFPSIRIRGTSRPRKREGPLKLHFRSVPKSVSSLIWNFLFALVTLRR